MLSVPAPTRIPLATLQVGGKTVEVFLAPEWARYFQSLNAQVVASGAALAQSNALTALLDDTREDPDVLPAPPGPRGLQGDPGMALFMLQDDGREEALLVPPCVDGVYVPLNTKDAPNGVPGLTQLKLNLKNAVGTVTSWFTSAASAARTWTMPDKDGTVAMTSDFASPPAIGTIAPAAGNFTALTATTVNGGTLHDSAFMSSTSFAPSGGGAGDWQAGKFGCNGKAPQGAAASGGTLAGVIAALVANGILSS